MASPRVVKAVQQYLGYLERGALSRQEAIDKLGMVLTDDDTVGVFEAVAPEHHPLIQAGHREALQRRADEDCLQPEGSPFDPITHEYHARVVELLLASRPGEPPRAQFAVVCLPSFRPEWSLRLHRPPNGSRNSREPTLVLVRANEPIWGATVRTVETTRHTRPIGDALATRLERVWGRMLESTRASRYVGMGVDGVTYHFEHRHRAGQTWTPRPNTRAGRFVQVADSLARYTGAEELARPAIESELIAQLERFEV